MQLSPSGCLAEQATAVDSFAPEYVPLGQSMHMLSSTVEEWPARKYFPGGHAPTVFWVHPTVVLSELNDPLAHGMHEAADQSFDVVLSPNDKVDPAAQVETIVLLVHLALAVSMLKVPGGHTTHMLSS